MTDYLQEQEMEIEALQAILMEDIEELSDSSVSGLQTSSACFQITISPKDEDDDDDSSEVPVLLALFFSHTKNYPDEPPLINIKSLKGIKTSDIDEIKQKIQNEITDNLGMAMMYTLAIFAKEWLREKYGKKDLIYEEEEEGKKAKEEVIVPHGLPVNTDTFIEWRERYEAEIALEKAKLMPELLLVQKETKLTGRQWFESGKNLQKGVQTSNVEEFDDDDDEIDFDEDFDEDVDEEDVLDHYLNERS